MYTICGKDVKKDPNLAACAYWLINPCQVYSYLSEEEAKRTLSGDGITVWEHEKKHCDGWTHP